MNILEQVLLQGPNLYRSGPCLCVLAEEGAPSLPGLSARLLALLPGLGAQAAVRLADEVLLVDALEPVTMELQRLAGAPDGDGATLSVAAQPLQRRVVCGYALAQVAQAALATGVELLDALGAGRAFDLQHALAALREVAMRHAIGTSTGAVLEAAHRRGIPSLRLLDTSNLFQLGWGSRQRRLQATITGSTKAIAVHIASDKQLTKTLLDQAGLPVPRGDTVDELEQAQRVARALGGKVTLKPLDANQGKGVTVGCATPDEVARAFEHARTYGRQVIVEEHLEGRDYRVLVTGDRIAAASWRRPPCVVGDGRATIRQLVELENRNPARGDGHANILTRIPLDDLACATLAQQGYTPDTVLAAGAHAELRGNANLSTGGTAEDVTDLVHEETRAICLRAARTIGLDVAGIDIVCRDIAVPLAEQHGGIIEVNAAPGIRMHQYPSRGKPRDAGDAIVESLFGHCDGRIPVVAVTGALGATTTSLAIAHAVRMAGLRSGAATTSGVYIDSRLVREGDCAGYHAARSVLAAPEVDVAVLETAPAGILAHGLAFDRCDVAVVLNVADGVDAAVHAVLARHAARAVVLNADDRQCVAMAWELPERVEAIYFGLDAENPQLLRHLGEGGRALYLQDNAIVLATDERHQVLVDVRALVGADVTSAMAAASALVACGFGDAEIADGLRSLGRWHPARHPAGSPTLS